MGRNRVEFPFPAAGPSTVTGTWTFNGHVIFNGLTDINNDVSVNGAAGIRFHNISVLGMDAGTTMVINGQAFFNQFASFQPGSQLIIGANIGGASIFIDPNNGFQLRVRTGAVNDFVLENQAQTVNYMFVPTGTSVPVFPQGIKVNPTQSNLAIYVENSPFTPTPNAFTIVNGTGGVTFAGWYTQVGKFVHYEIIATLTGTATLAATVASNFTNIPFLTPPKDSIIANHVTDNAGTNYGHGATSNSGAHFSPAIGATHGGGGIVWSCDLLVS
jgi:hypothetical protein